MKEKKRRSEEGERGEGEVEKEEERGLGACPGPFLVPFGLVIFDPWTPRSASIGHISRLKTSFLGGFSQIGNNIRISLNVVSKCPNHSSELF